jgi:pimeloyl-ACP methyl ester carboxylesterase
MRVRFLLAATAGLLLLPAAGAAAAPGPEVHIAPCGTSPLVLCGSIRVPPYWARPGFGKPLTVRFRVYRHTDRAARPAEPVVALEGGPGYGSIGSAGSYLFMLGRLHRAHDLIVMDQRGTGSSSVIDCPALQNGVGSYEHGSAVCARQLGLRAGAYGTAAVADDMAAILRGLGIPRVDVYGDSYGTYAAQAFALHHPAMVRAAVLDGTFDQSFNPLEPEESASLRHAWRAVCRRSGACSGILRSISAFDRQLAAHPLVGRGHDQDGYPVRYRVTPAVFAQLVGDATYSYSFFRDLPGALRAFRHGDQAPLRRLAAEDASFDASGGSPADYSVGDQAAVSCHDFPSVWDVSASPAQRRRQLDRAIARLPDDVYAPFSKRVWLASLYQNQLVYGCLQWPAPTVPDPAFPAGPRPHIPVLVLDGEYDQATPVADARRTAAHWPDSTYVEVRNTAHISALADFQGCASGIVRRYLRTLSAGDAGCARHAPAVEVTRFPRTLAAAPAARRMTGDRSGPDARRAVWVAAATVGDAYTRWYNLMYGSVGHGLRGGRYTTAGPYYSMGPVHIRFAADRYVADLAVSGPSTWTRRAHRLQATLVLTGAAAASGRIVLEIPTGRSGARAVATGVLGGRRVHLSLQTPWTPQG